MWTDAALSGSNLLIKDVIRLRSCSNLAFGSFSQDSPNLQKVTDLSVRTLLRSCEGLVLKCYPSSLIWSQTLGFHPVSLFSFQEHNHKPIIDFIIAPDHIIDIAHASIVRFHCYGNLDLKPSTLISKSSLQFVSSQRKISFFLKPLLHLCVCYPLRYWSPPWWFHSNPQLD